MKVDKTEKVLRFFTVIVLAILTVCWFLPNLAERNESLNPGVGEYGISYTEMHRLKPEILLTAGTAMRLALLLLRKRMADRLSMIIGSVTCVWVILYPQILELLLTSGGIFRYNTHVGLTGWGYTTLALCVITCLSTVWLCILWYRPDRSDVPAGT